ncbi:replication initiator [Microbacterium sp. M1A1_1b]
MGLAESVARRLRSPEFDRWMRGAARVGFCTNPVRLVGASTTFGSETGEERARFSSADQPDHVLFTRCGNRRAQRCASCSHEYKGDTWHMIMAGAAGGMKGVPNSVAAHPMVFLTLTAPSFGAVHGAACARAKPCRHGGRPECGTGHGGGRPELGDAICPDCYDYEGHVVWQYFASELWRRFTIQLRRELARVLGMSQRQASTLVRPQFAKVAEFQKRGAVHFHAIVRLDGVDSDDAFPAPDDRMTTAHLTQAIRQAARAVRYQPPSLPSGRFPNVLRWGRQIDVKPIVRGEGLDGRLSDRAVAAYIAKYATKATEDLDVGASPRPHLVRLRDVAEQIGVAAEPQSPYVLLERWSRMLGFRGHFSTKSRRYSVTLGSLREARHQWRLERIAAAASEPDAGEVESVLVVGSWSYAGMGWTSQGDKALAIEAARAAREWRDSRNTKRPDKGDGDVR